MQPALDAGTLERESRVPPVVDPSRVAEDVPITELDQATRHHGGAVAVRALAIDDDLGIDVGDPPAGAIVDPAGRQVDRAGQVCRSEGHRRERVHECEVVAALDLLPQTLTADLREHGHSVSLQAAPRPFTLDPVTHRPVALATTVVGSYPDATRLAVQDMERAGVDVITDGEMRRESYSNRFATALDGVDLDDPGVALDRTGHANRVPRVVGPINRTRPVEVRDVEFLRSITDRRIKITVPGPFTMTQQAQNDHYADDRSLALAYAEAVNDELRDLKAAGADVVQIDEPYLQARPEPAREYAIEAINRALDGIEGETVLHTCFGYAHIVKDRLGGYPFLRELADCDAKQISLEAAQPRLDPEVLRDLPAKTIVLGVLDLGSDEVETPEVVAGRIRKALEVVEPERLVVAPDCGMKYLSRKLAFRKLEAMVAGARMAYAG